MWSKESDWIPLSNAIGQVEFWQQDLEYALEYLDYVRTFEKYGLSNYDQIHQRALDDVNESREELENAVKKLTETRKRIDNQK